MKSNRMQKWLRAFFYMLTIVASVACSHLPKDKIPITANVSEEIDRLEAERAAAFSEQVNVLSPTYYKKSTSELKRAQESRASGADTEVTFDHLSTGRAYLEKAKSVSLISKSALEDVVKSRGDALAAGADKVLEKEFESIDDNLILATKAVESDDLTEATENRTQLNAKYRGVEVKAIKINNLGEVENLIKQAKKEGADEHAPRSLALAQKSFLEADSFISNYSHDKAGIDAVAGKAKIDAEHLLSVSRQAKTVDKNDSESLVLAREGLNSEIAAEKASSKADRIKSESDAKKHQIAMDEVKSKTDVLKSQNQKMTSDNLNAKNLELAKAQFSLDEAEVFLDGNRLVIRLKKMAFPSGKANLTPNSLPLLGKVRSVIADLGASSVVVEGHTDSIGSQDRNQKLSEVRAEAIGTYLRVNGDASNDIKAVGFGYSKPIASNKTSVGRAQNRRVDVNIEPMPKVRL